MHTQQPGVRGPRNASQPYGRLKRPIAGAASPHFPLPPTRSAMKPATDYIRHAARLARKLQMDAAMGGKPEPDAEFFKTLSKALEEIAAGLEAVSARE